MNVGRVAKSIIAALLIAGGLAYAETGEAGQAAAYLKMGVGARALGMGSAFVGISDDSTAAFWNPAGLAQMNRREITTMHAALSFDRKYNYANYVTPLPRTGGVLGLSYLRFGVDDINETRVWRWADSTKTTASRDLIYGDPIRLPDPADGNRLKSLPVTVGDDTTLKTILEANTYTSYTQWVNAYGNSDVEVFGRFADTETSVVLSYAQRYKYHHSILFGGSFKYLTHRLHSAKADTFGLDLGMLWIANSKTRLGLSVRDIGSRMKWNTPTGRGDEVPITTTLGISYNPRRNITLSMDVNKVKGLQFKYRFGGEVWLRDTIALRVGSDDKQFTAGTSFKIPQWSFDYAFKDETLGDEHRMSATRSF